MSYILDALKRADAERERGQVPGLHSRSAPTLDRPADQKSQRWLPVTLIGLGLLAAVAAGFWWWSSASGASPEPSATTPLATAPASTPANTAPSTASSDSAPTSAVATAPALPILAPEAPRPPRPATPAPARPADPAAAPSEAEPAAPTALASAAATPTTPNAANPSPVRSFADLSPEARAKLPAVNVSGVTYSQNPAHRMLIVNGKVVQEGGEIGPGLKLETIEQRSAVLNHQGLRYRIGY